MKDVEQVKKAVDHLHGKTPEQVAVFWQFMGALQHIERTEGLPKSVIDALKRAASTYK
jgi:hypothetical protein